MQPPFPTVQGTFTTVAHAAGATTLLVEMAGDFDDAPEGGVAYLRIVPAEAPDVDPVAPFVAAYSTWDGELEEQEFIVLTTGLPAAVPAGSEVQVWSGDLTAGEPVSVYEALVMPDDEDVNAEPLTVTVHPDLIDTMGSLDGLTADTPVLVETQESYDPYGDEDGDDELFLTRVLGGDLVRDGSFIDETTLPAPDLSGVVLEPTTPPASSPTIEATGITDGLLIRLTQPIEAGARVTYHLSADASAGVNFTPSAATAISGLTASGVWVASALPDGTALVEETPYFVRVVASNDVGSAAPSPGVQSSPDRSVVAEVVAAKLIAGYILTGRIDIGGGYISADEGIMIPNPDGSWSRLPFDGSPMRLLAQVIATALTVTGAAVFQSSVKLLRATRVGDGIGAPVEAPRVEASWPTTTTVASLPSTARIAGLAQHPTDSSKWLTAYRDSADLRIHLYSVVKATGALAQVTTSSVVAQEIAGLTVIGTRAYLLYRVTAGWRVRVVEIADGSSVATWDAAMSYPYLPAIGTDGTNVLIANRDASSPSITLRAYTPAGGTASTATITSPTSQGPDLAWVGYGSFNYGANRLVVASVGGAAAAVHSGTPAAPGPLQASFLNPTAQTAGMTWDGTRFQSLAGNTVRAHSATRIASESVTAASSYAGQTGAGTLIETNVGPTATATIPAQAQILITAPTPPEADLADPGVANRVGLYALVSGTQRKQAGPGIGVRAATIDTLSGAGRAAAATGTFTSAPGTIAPERGAEGSKVWQFSGTGAAKVGGLSVSATGVHTIDTGTDLDDVIRALVAGASLGTSTLRDDVRAAVAGAALGADILRSQIRADIRSELGLLSTGGFQKGVVATGTFTAVDTPKDVPVTFPVAYPSGVVPDVNVALSDVNAVQQIRPLGVSSVTNTGFTIRAARNQNTGTFNVKWSATPL